MNPDRSLADLNPSDRPARAPSVTPPDRQAAKRQPQTGSSQQSPVAPAPAPGSVQAADDKTTKVMHSVPADTLDRLKQAAARRAASYTDIVVACIVLHRDDLVAGRPEDNQPAGALARRRQHTQHGRARAAQLTLYLTGPERAELDQLASELGMPRSRLVTAALERGLDDRP